MRFITPLHTNQSNLSDNEKIAIKKYGKDGTSSGQMLGDILGKVLGTKKKKIKKKDKEEK